MNIQTFINQFKHSIKNVKHKTLRFYIWEMEDIGVAYVSTPKVASNSIRAMIRQRQAKILFNLDEDIRNNKEFKTRLDKKIKRSVKPSRIEASKKDLYLFSFVRNPLARLYSCYRDKVVNAEKRHKLCTLSPYGINFWMSFDDFVFRIAEIPDNKANDHFRSLHTFLTYQGNSFVDYVGKLENFSKDWQPLQAEFGLNFPQTDQTSRRVSGPALPLDKLPYTRKSAEAAARRYARDIELYDYSDDIDRLLDRR